jgi:hypothetical protein
MPHRYSTVAHLDLAAIRPLPPDLNDERVGAENLVMLCDLQIFVDEAVESVPS